MHLKTKKKGGGAGRRNYIHFIVNLNSVLELDLLSQLTERQDEEKQVSEWLTNTNKLLKSRIRVVWVGKDL